MCITYYVSLTFLIDIIVSMVYYKNPPAFKIHPIKVHPSQNPLDQNPPESKSTRVKINPIKIHPIVIHPTEINPCQNPPESKSTRVKINQSQNQPESKSTRVETFTSLYLFLFESSTILIINKIKNVKLLNLYYHSFIFILFFFNILFEISFTIKYNKIVSKAQHTKHFKFILLLSSCNFL